MSTPRPSDWDRWCEDMLEAWEYLRKHGPEMIRLAKMPTADPDGFPSGSGGERVSGSGSGDTSTELAGTAEAADSVCDLLFSVFGHSAAARGQTRSACKAVSVILRRRDMRAAHEVSGAYCEACGTWVSGDLGDRVRAGYCPACYASWRRWAEGLSDPDHVAFRKWRKAQLRPAAETEEWVQVRGRPVRVERSA